MAPTTRQKGDDGELIAVAHLKKMGLEIVETQYRFGKKGEIDIIARDGDTLVFCEVKLRKTDEFGPPEYAITPRKQQQIRRTAQGYLFEHEIREHNCRFDVVAIRMEKGRADINYLRNAF
jgi:putative endonuclease